MGKTTDYEDYDKFNSIIEDSDDDELEEDYNSYHGDDSIISILSLVSTWFIRLGMVFAVIVLLYFFINGKLLSAFLYILGLIIAYFFGYIFMYFLDKFVSMH